MNRIAKAVSSNNQRDTINLTEDKADTRPSLYALATVSLCSTYSHDECLLGLSRL